MPKDDSGYRKILRDDQSLAMFMRSMGEFERHFLDHMNNWDDYTLKLEVRGNAGILLHSRVISDGFKRQKGIEAEIDKRVGRKK